MTTHPISAQHIAIKYTNSIAVDTQSSEPTIEAKMIVATLNVEMMRLGYIMSVELFQQLCLTNHDQLKLACNTVIEALKHQKGDNVVHKPFYPNFPQQVMEASDVELWLNAILHYWTFGLWAPEYEKLPREYKFEPTNLITLGVCDKAKFKNIFYKLVTSKDSITDFDKQTILWFLANEEALNLTIPKISYKEIMCLVAGTYLKKGKDVSNFVETSTDVLRIATFLSDGDVSLTTNTKFKSLPRKQRKILTHALEKVIKEEDLKPHATKWVKLFHNLHVGEFSQQVYDVALKVRENEKINTFNGTVQSYIKENNIEKLCNLLVTRPSMFARRLDHLLRLSSKKQSELVIESFLSVVDDVPSRVKLQILGHLQTRGEKITNKIYFPKATTQRVMVQPNVNIEPIPQDQLVKLQNGIRQSLQKTFATLPQLNRVWVDPALKECPLPTQMRSASEGLFNVARGTKLPFTDDKSTIRLFVYWKGMDIDLSATFHDENFKFVNHVSYTNLRNGSGEDTVSCHSGDVTYAPNGASEFIDINTDMVDTNRIRYAVMNVYVFNGPTFAEHEECFVGWMSRKHVGSNEIYDPKTVEQRISLTSESKCVIPVVFDLVERKVIWTDVTMKDKYQGWGNNVESNQGTVEQTLFAIANINNKVSLYDLFSMHAQSRGVIVESKEEADVVYSMKEGITPFDIATINSEYIV